MEGLYHLIRVIIKNQKKIIQEQKKQTKILQAIESSKEQVRATVNPLSKEDLSNIGIVQIND